MRLSEFFDAFIIPNYLLATRAAPRNIDQYRETLKLWAELTGDPPLESIRQGTASAFVQGLTYRIFRGKQIGPNTIRKHCTALQKMLDLAGQRTRTTRIAAGLLSGELIYLERPPRQRKMVRDDFTLAEISSILNACHFAPQTTSLYRIPADVWWQTLYLFLMNTGMRIGSAMLADWEMFDPANPGWLDIPADCFKGRRQGGYFYVNTHARAALTRLREFVPKKLRGKSLFPWSNWPKSQFWLQSCRRQILNASDIPPRRRFGFHGCRKFLGTWLAPQNGLLASIVLGHKGQNTTRESYVNPKVVEEFLEKVPQPIYSTHAPWDTNYPPPGRIELDEDLGRLICANLDIGAGI
ncbi:MAG: tyrosine-type recombinase/integrase [Pirellulales bacterium]|nr:tyrosine-type recombinase/integrase [Pirellulales bacterium]